MRLCTYVRVQSTRGREQRCIYNWTASSEFGTNRLCEQRRFRRACASAQSRQNLRCSLIEAVNLEEPSDRKPDPWPLWMAGHAQLKFVMTECSKTQIRLTGPNYFSWTESGIFISCVTPLLVRNLWVQDRTDQTTIDLKWQGTRV